MGIAEIPQQEKVKATTFGSPTSFAINKTVKQKAAQKFLTLLQVKVQNF